jgi:hypothetical protein
MDYQDAVKKGVQVAAVVSFLSVLFGIPAAYLCSQNIFMGAGIKGLICGASFLLAPIMFIAAVAMRLTHGPTHFFGLYPISTSPEWYNLVRFYLNDTDAVAFKQIVEKRLGLLQSNAPGTVNEQFLEFARKVGTIENVGEWAQRIQELTQMKSDCGEPMGKRMLSSFA